jgi:16S rRNA (guanine(966)-N(2))-methyltransferase RsmD
MSLRIYGNRLVKTLSGQQTRPTAARVREALFNIWQGAIVGCHWLDLCAGAGSMSAEALCRGADTVVAIEQSGRACQLIRENLAKYAREEQQFYVYRADVLKQLPKLGARQYDRIYFDPPYHGELYSGVLDAIARYDLLAADGELAVEHDPNRPPMATVSHLKICRQKVYGNCAITFYRLETNDASV